MSSHSAQPVRLRHHDEGEAAAQRQVQQGDGAVGGAWRRRRIRGWAVHAKRLAGIGQGGGQLTGRFQALVVLDEGDEFAEDLWLCWPG